MTKTQPDTILTSGEANGANEVQFNSKTSNVNNGVNIISNKEFNKAARAVKKNGRKKKNNQE